MFQKRATLNHLGDVTIVLSKKRRHAGPTQVRLFVTHLEGVKASTVLSLYAWRWGVELFHKNIKQFLGFEDVSTSGFGSVKSHVYWVYCAYMLWHMSPPGVGDEVGSLGDKPRQLHKYLDHKEKRSILQKLTQIGGVQRYRDELRQALTDG